MPFSKSVQFFQYFVFFSIRNDLCDIIVKIIKGLQLMCLNYVLVCSIINISGFFIEFRVHRRTHTCHTKHWPTPTSKIFIKYEGQCTLNINSTALGPTAPSPKLEKVWAKKQSILFLRKVSSSRNPDLTHCMNSFRLMDTTMRTMPFMEW